MDGRIMSAVRRGLVTVVTLTATSTAAPARAEDGLFSEDCAPGTVHARHEYACEHERSRHLARLNCRGLAAYTESLRAGYNGAALGRYLSPQVPAAAPAPRPGVEPKIESLLNPEPLPEAPPAATIVPNTTPTPPPPPVPAGRGPLFPLRPR